MRRATATLLIIGALASASILLTLPTHKAYAQLGLPPAPPHQSGGDTLPQVPKGFNTTGMTADQIETLQREAEQSSSGGIIAAAIVVGAIFVGVLFVVGKMIWNTI